MADPQFEQFKQIFDRLPQHIKAPQNLYILAHDVSPDSCSEDSLEEKAPNINSTILKSDNFYTDNQHITSFISTNNSDDDRKEIISHSASKDSTKRKRRKLPPIPINQDMNNSNATSASVVFTTCAPSLADEIREAETREETQAFNLQLPAGVYFDYRNTEQTDIGDIIFTDDDIHLPEEDASPDQEDSKDHCVDFDSGNSTTHSPDGAKCFSPTLNGYVTPSSPVSSCSLPNGTLELLEASHRGLHKFIPRHPDEIDVEIGDPVYVQREADDLWCEGINLRSGKQGIFPGAYVIDVDYSDFDPDCVQIKKERYLLKFLGSLEVYEHKGNQVLCQAVYKIVVQKCPVPHPPHPCILEVSDQGLRIVDKSKPPPLHEPCHDYFFSLKNVTFCGYHPKDHRYFGFVTKHPSLQRFACHVFCGDESTRSVAEAVGRAFHRFYHKFIETAYPVEDIYLE